MKSLRRGRALLALAVVAGVVALALKAARQHRSSAGLETEQETSHAEGGM